jgi:hypothetical protein
MQTQVYHVELTFTEPLLGGVPKNKEIYADYIQAKAPNGTETADELDTVQEAEERGWTGFHTIDGRAVLQDRHVRGFMKDACGMLRNVSGSESS